MTTLPRVHANALPEHSRFPDTGCPGGCDLSLECPLPVCVYDDPGGRKRARRAVRDRQIVHRREQGELIEEIAAAFGVSKRTVHRVLYEHRKAGEL